MRLIICIFTVLKFSLLCFSASFAGTPTITLSSAPSLAEANGRSLITITAEVRDSDGSLIRVPTTVRFTASLGSIDPSIVTSGGVARASLRSGVVPGISTVTALVEGQPAISRIQVEFVPVGTVISKETFFTVKAEKYLGYSVDNRIIDAVGNVRVTSRGLSIEADEAQIDVASNVLKSFQRGIQKEIKISRRDKTFSCSALYFDLASMRGFANLPDGSQVTISGWDLQSGSSDPRKPDDDFTLIQLGDAGLYVTAKSISVRMNEEIQFKKAVLYGNGEKLASVRLYTIALDGSDASFGKYISVGSNGIGLDLPFYFKLEPQNSGSLRIKHNQPGGWGWYSTQPGWSLDLEQHYVTSTGSSGKLGFSRITQSDRGIHWIQDSQFSESTRGYFNFDSQNRGDVFGRASLVKSFSEASLGFDLYGNKYRDADADLRTDFYFRTNSRPLGTAFRYSVAARSSYEILQAYKTGRKFGQGIDLQIYSNPFKIGKGSLTSSLTIGRDWGGDRPGNTLLGFVSLNQRFSNTSGASMAYSFVSQPGFTNAAHHRIIGDLYAGKPKKWRSNIFFSYGLDYRSISSFADFTYGLSKNWRLGVSATYNSFATQTSLFGKNAGYTDLEIALARSLGKELANQDLALVWSKKYNKIRIQLRAARL